MLRVHVIYQWRYAGLTQRILEPFETLGQEGRLEVAFFAANTYLPKELSRADLLLLVDVSDHASRAIVKEARQRGIRVLYDEGLGSNPDAVSPGNLEESVMRGNFNVRSLAVRGELRRRADLVTVRDAATLDSLKCHGLPVAVIPDADANAWYDAISSVMYSPRQHPAETKGKKIFFLAPTFMWPHHYISDMLVNSLMQLGHTVHLFTITPSRFHSDAICLKKEFNSGFITSVESHSQEGWKIPLLIDREGADLVLTVQGYVIPRQILQEIRRRKIPAAAWFMDEPYDASRSCGFGRYFSHVFLQDKTSVPYHRHHGNPNTFYLPHGCDPTGIHAVPKNTEGDYLRDVALVGNPFPQREQLVNELIRMNIPVAVAGNGWQEADGTHRNQLSERNPLLTTCPTLSFDDAARYYRQTRINLNLHRHADDCSTNPGMFRAGSPNCSAFYIAGSGGFQLADSERPELAGFFTPGEEIVLFDTPDDCAEKIRHYLKNDTERRAIAERGRTRALRDHSYTRRLEEMLSVIDGHEPVSHDTGHRKVGYLQVSGIGMHPDFNIENSTLTLLDNAAPPVLDDRVKRIAPPREKGFAAAMNLAAFESTSDYLVVGGKDLTGARREIESRLSDFHNDLYAGMILFRGMDKERISGFAMPVRVLLEAGLFRFDNALLCVLDMSFRLRDMGLTVMEASLDATSLDDCPFSRDPTEKDLLTFRNEWTGQPEERLTAHRLMKNAADNAWKINKEEARRITMKSLEICPGFLKTKRQLAGMLLKEGNLKEAQQHLKDIRETDPHDFQSTFLYASSLYMSQQDDLALGVLDDLHPSDFTPAEKASTNYLKGLILKRKSDFGRARHHFLQTLDADPAHVNSLKELSLIALEEQRYEESLAYMKRRLLIAENDETLNDIGVIYWQSGEKEEAYRWFVKALEKNSACREAVGNIANAGVELGKLSEVRGFIKKALLHLPGDKELLELSTMIGQAL